MKLLELEICNVRGIRDVSLRPDGRNFVVYGPNGSGKSAVIDAIDFLLTGDISRLRGRGTGGITLTRHGPHVDSTPEGAFVRANVTLTGIDQEVEIKRSMARPETLECSAESAVPQLNRIESLAKQGQHILTRRDILRFIAAEPNIRAQQIQELLNLSEIEEIRQTLVTVRNNFRRDLATITQARDRARGPVLATLQAQRFDPHLLIQGVNKVRSVLQGPPIDQLQSSEIKKGLAPIPTATTQLPAFNLSLLQKDATNALDSSTSAAQSQMTELDRQLRETLATINQDPGLRRALAQRELVRLGLQLLDTDTCPLCDLPWDQTQLREHLHAKLTLAGQAEEYQRTLNETATSLADRTNMLLASVQNLVQAARRFELLSEAAVLEQWAKQLGVLSTVLSTDIGRYPDLGFAPESLAQLLAPPQVNQTISRILAAATQSAPTVSPAQSAWDTLTRLEENLKALEQAETERVAADLAGRRAAALHDCFLAARDKVLGALYDEIRDLFVQLYRALHGSHEASFAARIEPESAGLALEVDFYGRGMHPPLALHSEGHQDSMGLCLYLALAERLTAGVIDLVMLDDVVMSIDADHRREVCQLLSQFFPNRQFLITTHDKNWRNELRYEGVVNPRGMVEFHGWHVETGPVVDFEVDLWDRINEDLSRDDVPGAAGRLRRGMEEFFSLACDALEATVVFKLNGRWELGDLLPPAISRFNQLIGKAKQSAQRWGDAALFTTLQAIDSRAGQVFQAVQYEQWAVNANVHYNNWVNLSSHEFRPVVEAFQGLCQLFECSNCSSKLRLVKTNGALVGVRCTCGAINWNLLVT